MYKYLKACLLSCFFLAFSFIIQEVKAKSGVEISESVNPNSFEGTDTERIVQAIQEANGTSNLVRIPRVNDNGTNIWIIDSALLLPSNITIILDNCTLQLSDISRDNMFRSDNVGEGIENPKWNENINIYGFGKATLRGASNPRATGDGARTLALDPKVSKIKAIGGLAMVQMPENLKGNKKETGGISWY